MRRRLSRRAARSSRVRAQSVIGRAQRLGEPALEAVGRRAGARRARRSRARTRRRPLGASSAAAASMKAATSRLRVRRARAGRSRPGRALAVEQPLRSGAGRRGSAAAARRRRGVERGDAREQRLAPRSRERAATARAIERRVPRSAWRLAACCRAPRRPDGSTPTSPASPAPRPSARPAPASGPPARPGTAPSHTRARRRVVAERLRDREAQLVAVRPQLALRGQQRRPESSASTFAVAVAVPHRAAQVRVVADDLRAAPSSTRPQAGHVARDRRRRRRSRPPALERSTPAAPARS